MALTDAQWATAAADIFARLSAGTITESVAADELALATQDWPTRTLSNADLGQRVLDLIASINNPLAQVRLSAGVPGSSFGEVGELALDYVNGAIYGPKAETGTIWPLAVSLVGPPGGQGPAGTITEITVQTGAPGSEAEIVQGGTPSARSYALTLPRGDTGLTPDLSIGTVTTGAAGASADATITGPAAAPVLSLTLPRGETGGPGPAPNVTANINMIANGGAATVTRSGPDTAPVLTFNLPSPLDGADGREVEFQVSPDELWIQTRYVGEASWTNLISKAALAGAPGEKGDGLQIDARGANLAARDAYDAEPEDFTFLDLATGNLYWRETTTPGVWSTPVNIGGVSNAILDALGAMNATPGLVEQTGAATFTKRAIGAGADTSIPTRLDADGRYRRQTVAVPMADVDGLAAALGEKADAGAVLSALGGKQDADATLAALAGLDAGAGVLEQTGADTFTKRATGAGSDEALLTRAAGDGRYAPLSAATALAGRLDVLEAKPAPVLTVNGTAPDGAGNVVVDVDVAASGGATAGDMLRIMKAIAELKGSRFGTLNGFFDDFEDETGVDAAASAGEVYDSVNKGYTNGSPGVALIADMTSNTEPSPFVASGSSVASGAGRQYWHLFDRDPATWWTANDTVTQHVQIDLGSAKTVSGFTIKRHPSAAVPTGVRHLRSANGTTWTAADAQTGLSWATTSEEKAFTFASPQTYRYWRLEITAPTGAPQLGLDSWQLYAPDTYAALSLRSNPVTVPTVPDKLNLLVIARKEEATAPTANTEVIGRVSRDGGTTWTTATLIPRESAAGNVTFEALGIDVTGQPSGASIAYEIDTLDDTQYFIGAVGVYAEE